MVVLFGLGAEDACVAAWPRGVAFGEGAEEFGGEFDGSLFEGERVSEGFLMRGFRSLGCWSMAPYRLFLLPILHPRVSSILQT